MSISQIFYSVIAEGLEAGLPAVFLVTADGAPRQCWCGEMEKPWTPTFDTMFGGILSYARKFWCERAVITGAEPLNVEGVEEVADGLLRFDHHLTIETSGSVYRELTASLMSINAELLRPVVAVKRKKGEIARPYDLDVVREFVAHGNYQIRFQLTDRSELEEIREFELETKAQRSRIVLSAAPSVRGKKLQEQMTWMMDASRFFGYRITPRIG